MCPRRPHIHLRRLACRAALLAITVGLVGCLYSPADPTERRTGIDDVGPAGSAATFRIGTSTRAQISGRLGPPQRVGADGQVIGYEYDPVTGRKGYVALGGPCTFHGEYPWDVRTHETLWLAFDGAGVLCRAVSSREPNAPDWDTFCVHAAAAAPPTTTPATRPNQDHARRVEKPGQLAA